MATNIVNQMPYVRTARHFPEDSKQLPIEINKAYVDLANAVNSCVKGIFPANRPAITGEEWFLTGSKQQTLRQVYSVTSTNPIPHNINVSQISQFTRGFGTYTDGTNSYGLVMATSVAVAGIITFYLSSTQILFLSGAGAPALTSGTVVIEWLADV